MAEYFEAIPPQKEPKNGEQCICWKCGAIVYPFVNIKIPNKE